MERTPEPIGDIETRLVPGRECGSCNVCCVALTIDEPALQKPQGLRCRNARRDNSCAVYHDRPRTCREFYCGWRMLRWVKEPLRPDRSGVLTRLQMRVGEDGQKQWGLIITILETRGLNAEGLAETVAAAINADLAVYLSVPGPPGYTSSLAQLNVVLQGPVMVRDKQGVLDVLRQGRARGRKGERQRIVLKHALPAEASAGDEALGQLPQP